MRSLLRAQLRLAAGILVLLGVLVGGLPCSSGCSPGQRWRGARHAAGLGGARLRGLPDAAGARLVVRPAAERNEQDFTDVVERS